MKDKADNSIDLLRFEQLLESTPRGMHFYYLDEAGELIFRHGNAAADKILGISHKTLVGKTIEQAFPGLVPTEIPATYKKIAREGGKFADQQVEYSEGAVLGAFDVIAFQLVPGEMVATFENITERISKEHEIRKQNNFLSTLIESSPISIYFKELNGTISLCNQAFCDLVRLPESDIKGYRFNDLLPDEKTVNLIHSLELGLLEKGEGTSTQHTHMLDALGDPHEVMIKISLVKDSNNAVRGFLGYLVDISPLKQVEFSLKLRTEEYRALNEELASAEEELRVVNDDLKILNSKLADQNQYLIRLNDELRVSEARFRQLADNTDDVFWLWSGNQILYVNEAFQRIWGMESQAVIKDPSRLATLIHPDDRDSFRPIYFPEGREKNQPHEEQYRILRWGTEVRWLWSRTYPVLDDEGVVVRYAGIISDITDQKQIEKELIAAREQAVQSDRLKSAFLANISHEIRTPINGITGFSELLDNQDLKPEKRKMYVDIIKSSGLQLVRIIDDIIDISKIEANQLKLNFGICHLEKMIAELMLMYQKQLQQKGSNPINLRSTCKLSGDAACIMVDETRLRQIVINLMNNAIKFTEEGEVHLSCEIADNTVLFQIQDTGIGIPAELHQQIFKRFRQGSETLSRKYGGTGLGLAISEGLVHLLGGRIWFESQACSGSVFSFSIPYKQVAGTGEETRPANVRMVPGKWSKQQILIAEDDQTNYFYLFNILESTGAVLIHAKNGEEAVRFCKENEHITMVLMDIRMPVLNGYDATRQIRAIRKDIPIIAQTAYAMPEDQIKAMQAGCNAYISKPINRQQLMEMMEKYLSPES